MNKLVIVKNPFQPWKGRDVKTVPSGFTARQILEMTEFKGMDINLTVDGKIVENIDTYVVPDNNIIVVSPVVGKNNKILGLIATIAIAVVSFGVGGLASGAGMWGAGMATWSTPGLIAATATMFIGSMLVNRFMGATDYGNYSNENDPTYSWSGVQTMEGQNNPITITYGKVKSAGQTIGKFISVNENDEYLNWLVSAGEGVLSISNIKINDNPYSYYDNVEIETRSGTNNQAIIEHFNDTYSTTSLSYKLGNNYTVNRINANGTEGIKIKVEFSKGLYYAKDDGSLGDAWAEIKAEYRKLNGEWKPFWGEDVLTKKVTGNKASAIRQEWRVDNLEAGEYEVRIKIVSRSHEETNTRASTDCYWTEITSIVYDDFSYPNIALIGIRAKATDQLSGTPKLTFIKERKNVWVWNGSQYVEKPANNPAWASYDMLHLCSKLVDINSNTEEFDVRGAGKDLLIYEQFEEWANYCTNKNLKINIEITQAGEILDIINKNIANCGRGCVVRYGTRYGCVWDSIKQPVQMFGMGNIINGTFQEEFMSTTDRANCVEITYNDAEMDYERNTITIYSDTYDNDAEEKTAQATYNGITNYEQAYREGVYQLYCNKYLIRTVSFEANIDAIACTIGDVILVAHDVPKWSYSGRIYSVDFANRKMVLPVEIKDTTKNYRIAYRTVNDTHKESEITILSNGNGWCTVQCSSNFVSGDAPQENDIFDIAEVNVGTKPFLVKSITRSTDFTRKIECLEYNANIYDESYEIPPIDYTIDDKVKPVDVTNLVAKRIKCISINGDTYYKTSLSWEHEGSGTFNVYAYDENNNMRLISSGIIDNQFTYNATDKEDKEIKVLNIYDIFVSKGVVKEIEDLDYVEIASATNISAITTYRVDKDSYATYQIDVSWDRPSLANYQCCEVWYKSNSRPVMLTEGALQDGVKANELGYKANWIYAGTGTDSATIQQVTPGDEYKIALLTKTKAGDIMGFSVAPVITYIAERKTLIPNSPSNLKLTYTDKATVTWGASSSGDIAYYELGYLDGETENVIAKPTDVYADITLPDTNGTLYLYAVNKTDVKSMRIKLDYDETDLKPLTPVDLKLSFSETIDLQWKAIEYTLNYIVGYTENNTDTEILKTTSTTVSVTEPNTRRGTIYVIAENNLGIKSEKAYVNYYKAEPNAPTYLNLSDAAKTLYAKWSVMPSDCLYSHVVVTGNGFLESYNTVASTITIPNIENEGVYNVSVSYVDLFGEGKTINGNHTVKLFIDKELIDSEVITKVTQSTQATQAIESASTNITNVAVKGLLGNGSALTMKDGELSLVASNGEKLTGMFINESGVIALDGKYIHVTGNSVFDNNVKINGFLDVGNSIVAGPVTISNTGIDLTINSGTLAGQKVCLNANGLQFVDTNNNAYSTLGRTIVGYAEHGKHVTFGNAWLVKPTVLITPISLPQYSSDVFNYQIEQRCKANNVTVKGFDVVCANYIISGETNQYAYDFFSGYALKNNKNETENIYIPSDTDYYNQLIIYVIFKYTGAVYDNSGTSAYTNKNGWFVIDIINQKNNSVVHTITTTKHNTSARTDFNNTYTYTCAKGDAFNLRVTAKTDGDSYYMYNSDLRIEFKYKQTTEVVVKTSDCAFTAFETSNAEYTIS